MQHDSKVYEQCPHCGAKLTLWQQVLLSVDRTLMCRNCWYRIVLDKSEEEQSEQRTTDRSQKEEE